MRKIRDLFKKISNLKKIRDTNGTFHAKMGTIKDRNGMDLTEAEDIKKRWQEYMEELYKKNLLLLLYWLCQSLWCVDHNKQWKILKEMGIPDHLTCLLRNLYAGQEATVRTGHGTTNWFQIGKGVPRGCILSPCLFNLYAEYIMRNAELKKHKLESRLPGEISITSDMQMTPPSWQKVKRN